MDMARPQTILIIGGDLNGLAFAQLLRHSPFASTYNVQIFEHDPSPTPHDQGNLIGINTDGMSYLSPILQISSVLDGMPPKPFAIGMVDEDLNLPTLMCEKHRPRELPVADSANPTSLPNLQRAAEATAV